MARQCLEKASCEQTIQGEEKCNRPHHKLLHSAHVEGIIFHNAVHAVNADNIGKPRNALLMISSVTSKGKSLITLWDSGANTTLITHNAAQKLGLKGEDVFITITKVGNDQQSCDSKEYIVPLVDRNGKWWNIRAIGMDEITSNISPVPMKEIAPLFRGITERDIVRPVGEVDLLVATDCCTILPNKVQQVGNLQLMSNQFGYCVRGSHSMMEPSMKESNHIYIKLHHVAVQVADINIHVGSVTESIHKKLNDFFDVESMGVCCAPKCGSCECGKWSEDLKNITIAQEREMSLIRKGLHYNEEERCWTCTYPWIRDPEELPSNLPSALGRLKSLERRLLKSGKDSVSEYDGEVKGMVERGVARKLTDQEVVSYTGPVHYIPHFEVIKPESLSTQRRIVFDSSSSYMGHTLNAYWAKGPDVINSLVGVLLRFRVGLYAFVGDISKMYNSVRISILDQNTHRFLWRDGETDREPDHYVLTRVTFGDRPSGAIATVAMRCTADQNKENHPKECEIIERDSYVDDILSSVNEEDEVLKMTTGIEYVLQQGGFHVKHWITSLNPIQHPLSEQFNIIKSSNEKVLGVWWNPEQDKFSFKAKINFSEKHRKVHTENDISINEVRDSFPDVLTRRMVLSQVAKIYDPLGLLAPFILNAKILLRKSCNKNAGDVMNIGWDDPLPHHLYNEWKAFFIMLFDTENLSFPRCIQPKLNMGEPILVIYCDGSKEAFGACAYVRWKVGPGRFCAMLVIAKNRIAPARRITIPRMELCGAVIAVKLRKTIEQEIDIEFDRVMHITDSTIVRNQIESDSHEFATFTGNRIAEIQSKSKPDEWWWTPSKENPADLITRAADPNDLGEDSFFQTGPEYLKTDTSLWHEHISQSQSPNELPDKIKIMYETIEPVIDPSSVVSINRFNDVNKLHKITAIVLNIAERKRFAKLETNSTEYIQRAELCWVKYYQRSCLNRWKSDFKNLGPSLNEDGVIIVGHRLSDGFKESGTQPPMLLPRHCEYTQLYCTTVHNECHTGIEDTIVKVRKRMWVPKIRSLIKNIKKNCIRCRFLEKRLLTQIMSPLPVERLNPSPAFHHSAVDLFGPFSIRDNVKKRTFGKAYGVLFNCLYSRAVYLDLADGYDTESFLLVLRRFVAIRGYPGTLRSDHGSQLICASKELKAAVSDTWDWDSIHTFGERHHMRWILNKSADAPWENGCSESLIKSTKKCLLQCIGTNRLTFSELLTAFFEVGNMLNERPIGTKTTNPNEGSYLCPNDLLLGRTSHAAPIGQFSNCANGRHRLDVVNEIVASFERKWLRYYFPTLIVQKKWHTEARNLCVGDIVIVQPDSVDLTDGKWRLAQVSKADKGRDDKVRSVTLRYKQQGHKNTYKGVEDTQIQRSVHRLVLILPVEEQDVRHEGDT